jgi:hypothetical protein
MLVRFMFISWEKGVGGYFIATARQASLSGLACTAQYCQF